MTRENVRDIRSLGETVATEIWSQGEVELVDQLYSDEFSGEVLGLYSFQSPADYKGWVQHSRVAFPDLTVEIDEMFEAGDVICGKWTARGTHTGKLLMLDLEPTGESVEYSGLFIAQIHEQQVVKEWHCSDFVTMMVQLGLLPESPLG